MGERVCFGTAQNDRTRMGNDPGPQSTLSSCQQQSRYVQIILYMSSQSDYIFSLFQNVKIPSLESLESAGTWAKRV